MKKITVRQFATIKRVAQNVNPLVTRKNKIIAKIAEMSEELEDITNEISGHEAGIMALTGGYKSEDIVTKVVENTDKVDAKGQPIKITKYVATDIIAYNEGENYYELQDKAPVNMEAPEAPVEAKPITESTEEVVSTSVDADFDPFANN